MAKQRAHLQSQQGCVLHMTRTPLPNSTSAEINHKRHYQSEQQDSHRCCHCRCNDEANGKPNAFRGRQKLFSKVLKQSDIQLYRLALPKNEAEKHFSPQARSVSEAAFLPMVDGEGRIWTFKYSFWKSSQSYVLASKWRQFVKDNNLSSGDKVCFLQSTGPDKRLYVECKKHSTTGVEEQPDTFQPTLKNPRVRLFGVDISI